ncbi:MAG TPA: rod shape-determining protein RodA [Terriglobales bacterium]|nr:rod shape-determining protein RodA [Terriglobales bacterium]
MKRYISFRDFDWLLVGLVLLICGLGVVQIFSATHNTRYAGAHEKQVYWILAGLAMMFLVSRLNYQVLLEQVHWMYGVSVLSLVAVLVFGQKYMGARRWIRIHGTTHVQPSEWVKLVLILAVAKYWADNRSRECTWADIIKAGMLVGVPCLLVLVQPDLGTTLTYIPVVVMGLFLGGMRFKQGAALVIMAALLAPVGWHVLKPYQRERLTSFMEPEADYHGSGYQVIQSLIAVGSGGLTGKGLMQGSQSALNFLPVPQTDFIFAAFAEEHGFVGAIGLLLLYFMVLMRLIHNAQTAPDRAGGFVVMGVVAVFAFHILVNVGMVVGFMPVTGIPLPLMSYGGSSVLFMFLALGIVMNIRMRRFVN